VRRPLALAAIAFALAAPAAPDGGIGAFSALQPGQPLPAPWREIRLARWKPPEYALVRDGEATVLRVRSESAAGTMAHALDADPSQRPRLAWRWKVDRVVEAADLARREGDDYAARVYVFFDVPLDDLPFAERLRIHAARLFYGTDVPAAAISYVWDNRHPVGTVRDNAYTGRVRMMVLESGAARVGSWVAESRDLESDFRIAFPNQAGKPVPRITGVALGNDTDQTHESVTAWFGDLRLEARR
jgi:hypothetical protein